MDTIAVRAAFWTAVLLGNDMTAAECSVLEGINACDEASHSSIVIESVSTALRRRPKHLQVHALVQLLPAELCRLFILSEVSRDCLVLRLLVGLPPEICARLLDISIPEFEDALYSGLNQLPFLFSPTS
jgi:hypothetical protein